MDLDTFGGWDDKIDLFQDEVKPTTETEDETKDIDNSGKESKNENQEEKTVEEDLFGGLVPENTKDTEDEPEDKKSEEIEIDNISAINFLKEKGLLDIEEDEEVEFESEEDAEDFIKENFEKTVYNKTVEMLQSLPKPVQALNKYIINGGSLENFISHYNKTFKQNTTITDDLDLEDENNQELVAREMLRQEGKTDDEIEAEIEYYKDSGKLKTISENKYKRFKESRKKFFEQEAIRKEQEAEQKRRELLEAKREMSNFLSKNDAVGDISFSKDDKRTLSSYVNEPSVQLEDGRRLTKFQTDLFGEILKNPVSYMQLAVLTKNRNKDGSFNFDNIKKQLETKANQKVKKNLRNNKTNVSSKKSFGNKELSLEDIFKN